MTLSIHDNQIISYEVQCEWRIVTLRTEYREENKQSTVLKYKSCTAATYFRYCVKASNSLRNCSGVNGTNAGGTTLY